MVERLRSHHHGAWTPESPASTRRWKAWIAGAGGALALGLLAAAIATFSEQALYSSPGAPPAQTTQTSAAARTTTEPSRSGRGDRARSPTPPVVAAGAPPSPASVAQTANALAATFREIDDVYAHEPPASVAYSADRNLQRGERGDVELRVSLTKSVDQLKKKLSGIGQRQGATIRAAPVMEAELKGGGDGVAVEELSPKRQTVGRSVDTAWRWRIEAKKTGTWVLNLSLVALVDVGGTTQAHQVGDRLDVPIIVRVSWQQMVAGFVGANWHWLWTAILAPLVVAGWGAWRRRKPPKPLND